LHTLRQPLFSKNPCTVYSSMSWVCPTWDVPSLASQVNSVPFTQSLTHCLCEGHQGLYFKNLAQQSSHDFDIMWWHADFTLYTV